jgi:hypothetical protein
MRLNHQLLGPYASEIDNRNVLMRLKTKGRIWRIADLGGERIVVMRRLDLSISSAPMINSPHD